MLLSHHQPPRRPNKLRKPAPASRLSNFAFPPLSFIQEPPIELLDIPLIPSPDLAHSNAIPNTPLSPATTPESPEPLLSNIHATSSSPSISSGQHTMFSSSSQAPLLPTRHGADSPTTDYAAFNGPLAKSRTMPTTRKLTKRKPSLPSLRPTSLYVPLTEDGTRAPLSNTTPEESGLSETAHHQRRSTISFVSLRARKKNLPERGGEGVTLTSLWGRRRVDEDEPGQMEAMTEVNSGVLLAVRPSSPFQVDLPFRCVRRSSWNDNILDSTRPSRSASPTNNLSEFAWTGIMPPAPPWSIDTEHPHSLANRPKFTLGDPGPQKLPPSSPNSRSNSFVLSPTGSTSSEEILGDVFTPSSGSAESSASGAKKSASRPPLVRRNAAQGPRRRWTLAMAMTDEDITDEVLVEQLERMRTRRQPELSSGQDIWLAQFGQTGRTSGDFWLDDKWADYGEDVSEETAWKDVASNGKDVYGGPRSLTAAHLSKPLPPIPNSSDTLPPSSPSTTSWKVARRALLTCRELVRTERRYLSSLQALINGETTTAPPPLMQRYAQELVNVSEAFVGHMEDDPSVWGVAVAFLTAETELESALVAWCGVVGDWFTDSDSKPKPKPKAPTNAPSSAPLTIRGRDSTKLDVGNASPLKRSVSTWRRSMPSIASLNTMTASKSNTSLPNSTSSTHSQFLTKKKDKQKQREIDRGKARVRDLAILPTQRVMRYALLYQDLLAHTPTTSPSRALVDRALEVAMRIAGRCDRAQDNAAFFRAS